MNSETRNCQACKQSFVIEPEDFQFYEKMQVPPPKNCPICRRMHLLTWRNERTLYARECAATKKPILSVFSPESPYTVYDRDYWWSDAWDPLEYGQEIDFSKTFAEQYGALMRRVPMAALFVNKCENTSFSNHSGYLKNCYLTFATWEGENLFFCDQLTAKCKDSLDCLECRTIEQCYELNQSDRCFNCKYLAQCEGCIDSWFLYDCKDCSDCIGCANLRRKKFCIFNEQLSKEEYTARKQEMQLATREGIEAIRTEFEGKRAEAIIRFARLVRTEDSLGDNLQNVQRCRYCFSVSDAQDVRYSINGLQNTKDGYELYGFGADMERSYFCVDTGIKTLDNIATVVTWSCQYAYYTYNCHSSFELFGCLGVRGKKYCIFNKEYTRDEYKRLKTKLIAHMRETGEWGEYFQPSISPFCYNETLAMILHPLAKEEALRRGFDWRENFRGSLGKETLRSLPQTIEEVPDSILKEVLACTDCKKNYKIISQELAWYRAQHLPLPSRCPNCRYLARVATRPPLWLWEGQCTCAQTNHFHGAVACPHTFMTPHRARSEKVYCEECYNAEVV